MKFALLLMSLLLLTGTVAVKGQMFPNLILNPGLEPSDEDDGAAPSRPERGLKIIDLLRQDSTTKSPKGRGNKDNGFNLEDALVPESKKPEPPKKGDNGFNLEDALNPGWQSNMIQKLGEVIKNQHQQIEMLNKLLARVSKQ